ncbi:hypothetical protein [Streptomyces xanthochromogenes]|uniref:Uncharacterized protein n=1 Tax=Streptomyces xanthochromogenes TaxID=67384 RepID=A0ABQ3AQZ3_9ACTN|nr:hypothetical protein [Streptomyces xanthochromogenes]GGY61310.1 hypothetical protein GCM10010326_65150 [Streptomyces xanthochromogenes]
MVLALTKTIQACRPRLDPLEIALAYRIVSVMSFRYDVCGVDFCTAAAVGIAVKPQWARILPGRSKRCMLWASADGPLAAQATTARHLAIPVRMKEDQP